MWTRKFQMFGLDLEKAEESEIKLPASVASLKKWGGSRKNLLLFYWIWQRPWLCGLQQLWEILKEMWIPDHLTCFMRNLYAGQEAIVRTGHRTTDWFQIRKGVCQGCILSSCLFNLNAEYIMQNTRLDESQKLESRLPGEISITLDMQMTPHLWQKAKKN